MKRYLLLIFSALITSLTILTGCQDEDFGFTQEEVFKGAYERNFEAKYGKIDPNQSWDLSTYGQKNSTKAKTRAGEYPYELDTDGYYRIEQGTTNWVDSKMINGNDNHALGTAFGMLMAGEDFIAIPVSQQGFNTVTSDPVYSEEQSGSWPNKYVSKKIWTTTTTEIDWTLKMVVLEDGKTPVEVPLWSKGMANNLQTVENSNQVCDICHGRNMIPGDGDIPCKNCNQEGWLPGTESACPTCDRKKTIERPCTICNAEGLVTCRTCGGNGYTIQKPGIWNRYYGCTDCVVKGSSWSYFKGWNYTKGNGLHKCYDCGGDKILDVTCPKCHGVGTMTMCEICSGKGYGIPCTNSQCIDGLVGTTSWIDLPAQNYNSSESKSHVFRSKPWDKSRFTGYTSGFPEGSIIYFYLQVEKKTTVSTTYKTYDRTGKETGGGTTGPTTTPTTLNQSSLSNKMIVLDCPRPTNINSDYQVMMIGVEEDSSVDQDFNDLVFLIIGKPLPEIFNYQSGKPVSTPVKKRYMVEDLGSSCDWDFNDIVVDVNHETKRKLTESNGIVSSMSVTTQTDAVIRYLCGTISLQVQIGNTKLGSNAKGNNYWIQDPTDMKQTTYDLEGSVPSEAEFPDTKVIGWSPTFEASNIQGYDPDLNNITIRAKHKDSSQTESDNDYWEVQFPSKGSIPYIIATNQNIVYMGEGEDIPDSWWKPKHDTTTGN